MKSAQIVGQTSEVSRADVVSAKLDRMRRIRAIVGASSGNLVEWYDFFAYAFTSIYFASSFFPSGDQTSQLLATTGIFAIGFFMDAVPALGEHTDAILAELGWSGADIAALRSEGAI